MGDTNSPDDPLLSLRRSTAADLSWGNTIDWTARTAPGRQAFEDGFLKQAGGDPKRAAKLRAAHFKAMRAKSLATRKANAAARKAEIEDGGAA